MFKQVTATNFLSWADLNFEFSSGVTLIEGWNQDDQTSEGSGKSAILNALCWCLFGRIPKDAKIDDVVRDGTKSCEVSVDLDSGARIVRSRRPNDLYIELGTERKKGKDAKETQSLIENLIGMSFETFVQSVYFAQNYPNKFVTASEEDKARILSEILNLKQFDRARTLTVAKLRETELESSIAEKTQSAIEIRIMSVDQQVLDFTFLRESQQREQDIRVARLSSEFDQVDQEIQGLEGELLSDSNESIAKQRDEVLVFIAEAEEIQKELGHRLLQARRRADLFEEWCGSELQLQTKLRKLGEFDEASFSAQKQDLLSKIDRLQENKADLSAKFLGISQQKKFRDDLFKSQVRKLNELKGLEEHLAHLTNPVGQTCSACGTPLADADPNQVGTAIIQTEHRIRAAKSELVSIDRDLESVVIFTDQEIEKQINEVNADLKAVKAEAQSVESILQSHEVLRNDIASDSIRLETLQAKISELVEVSEDAVRLDIDNLSATIADARTKERALAETAARRERLLLDLKAKTSLRSKIANDLKEIEQKTIFARIDQKLADLGSEHDSLEAEKQKAAGHLSQIRARTTRLRILKDGFREIKAYVFQNILGELTRKANAYLIELFEVPVSISFSNLAEDGEISKILVEVTYDGIARPLGLYSGGQFRRIQLAVDLALSEIVSSRGARPLQLRILDEYFKDLSLSSMEKALTLLEKLPGTTILIEHNELFKTIVNSVFRVELEDGVSRKAA